MNWIQRLGSNCPKKWGLILCLVCGNFLLYAQSGIVKVSFGADRVPLSSSKHYYLLDVLDNRPVKGGHLGTIIQQTQRASLELNASLESQLYEFWKRSLPRKETALFPIILTINTLSVQEKRQSPGRIKGEAAITVDLSWRRGENEIKLTTFKAKSEYTRPETAYNPEPVLRKMVTDALQHFDKWMGANIGRNPLLIRTVRLVFTDVDYPDKADTVFYRPGRKLTYADFQAAPRPGRYAAMVFTSIAYEGNSKVKEDYLEVEIKMKVYMVKSMSWMAVQSRNEYVLGHEQLHFDIANVIAQRFKNRLRDMPLTVEDHDSEIQYQFLEAFREMNRLQEQYDQETRHGLNAVEQTAWNQLIMEELHTARNSD